MHSIPMGLLLCKNYFSGHEKKTEFRTFYNKLVQKTQLESVQNKVLKP